MTACLYPHEPERSEHPAKHGFLCESGYRRLEQHLSELPALSGWLHANLPRSDSGGYGDYTTGSKDMPLPIRDGIADHQEAIVQTVNSWARLVAEERDLHGPWKPLPQDGQAERDRLRRAVEQTATLTELVVFLLAHLPWSAEQLWIDDYTTEIEDLTATAHSLAPSIPRTYRMPAPCPTCSAMELHRKDGDDYVSCGSCGRLWSEQEYVRLVVVLAGEVDLPEWVPVAVVAVRFGLNPATVWKWKQRGLLQAKRDRGQVLVRLVCDVPGVEEGVA